MTISTIRSSESRSIVMLDKHIILNPNLSLEAVGAYAILESHKGLSPSYFRTEIQNELISIGYLVEVKV